MEKAMSLWKEFNEARKEKEKIKERNQAFTSVMHYLTEVYGAEESIELYLEVKEKFLINLSNRLENIKEEKAVIEKFIKLKL
jgi:hypothetical protein